MSKYAPNDFPSKYEELLTFYPVFYRDVFEMDEILRTEGKLADGIVNGIDAVIDNSFVVSADEQTISRWENIFDISPEPDTPLETRRTMVLLYFLNNEKINKNSLIANIKAFVGKNSPNPLIKFNRKDKNKNCILDITLRQSSTINFASLIKFLKIKLPAHIKTCLFYSMEYRKKIHSAAVLSTTRKYSILSATQAGDFAFGFKHKCALKASQSQKYTINGTVIPPDPVSDGLPYSTAVSGDYFLTLSFEIKPPDSIPQMQIYYSLVPKFSQEIPFQLYDGRIFQITKSMDLYIFGRYEDKLTKVIEYIYEIEPIAPTDGLDFFKPKILLQFAENYSIGLNDKIIVTPEWAEDLRFIESQQKLISMNDNATVVLPINN